MYFSNPMTGESLFTNEEGKVKYKITGWGKTSNVVTVELPIENHLYSSKRSPDFMVAYVERVDGKPSRFKAMGCPIASDRWRRFSINYFETDVARFLGVFGRLFDIKIPSASESIKPENIFSENIEKKSQAIEKSEEAI